MTEQYIRSRFEDIKAHANDIERRLDDSWLTAELLIKDNEEILAGCQKYGCEYILISDGYQVDIEL